MRNPDRAGPGPAAEAVTDVAHASWLAGPDFRLSQDVVVQAAPSTSAGKPPPGFRSIAHAVAAVVARAAVARAAARRKGTL